MSVSFQWAIFRWQLCWMVFIGFDFLIAVIGYTNDKRKRAKTPGAINRIKPILINSIHSTVSKNALLNKCQDFWKAFFQDFSPLATSIEAIIQKVNIASTRTPHIVKV